MTLIDLKKSTKKIDKKKNLDIGETVQNEQKPLPSVELSLKFMSWSVKEAVEAMKETNRVLDQKLSEVVSQLRELNSSLKHRKEVTPF